MGSLRAEQKQEVLFAADFELLKEEGAMSYFGIV